jgi:hypothetical protein
LFALIQSNGKLIAVANEEALGTIAQGEINERRELPTDGEKSTDDAKHSTPGPGAGAFEMGEDLANASAEPFVAALEVLEDLDTADQGAALRSQVGGVLGGLVTNLLQAIALGPQAGLCLAGGCESLLERRLGGKQLLQLEVQRGKVLGRLIAALLKASAFPLQGGKLCLVTECVIVQPGGLTDLIHVPGLFLVHGGV